MHYVLHLWYKGTEEFVSEHRLSLLPEQVAEWFNDPNPIHCYDVPPEDVPHLGFDLVDRDAVLDPEKYDYTIEAVADYRGETYLASSPPPGTHTREHPMSRSVKPMSFEEYEKLTGFQKWRQDNGTKVVFIGFLALLALACVFVK